MSSSCTGAAYSWANTGIGTDPFEWLVSYLVKLIDLIINTSLFIRYNPPNQNSFLVSFYRSMVIFY